MADEIKIQSEQTASDEIDFIQIISLFKSNTRLIFKYVLLFVLIGLLIAFTSRVEYMASSKLLPESDNNGALNMGGLGGLAGLAGINLDATQSGNLSPEIYPAIVNSLPFLISVSNETIHFEALGEDYTPFYYFDKVRSSSLGELLIKYTVGLPGLVVGMFSSDEDDQTNDAINSTTVLTRRERKLIDKLSERISLESDLKTGIITLTVEMPDAYAAAQLAEKVTDLLTQRIIQYRIEKAKVNLDFIEERYEESRKDYERRLQNLAVYTDRNVNVISSVAQIEIQRLQNEVDVAFGVYKELATQLENAKIKVKEQTPVLTILEPAAVPVQKSSPKRLIILISSIVLGLLIASTTILFSHILRLE